jgi:periplasmic binding family protein
MKKMSKALVVGASLLACAGTAQASADIEINLAGASAQWLFWNDVADSFLTQAEGCTTVTQNRENPDITKSKQGWTKGTNCVNRGGKSIIIRYSSKASYDGIRAQKGIANTDDSFGAVTIHPTNGSSVINGGVAQLCSNANQRPLADEDAPTANGGYIGSLVCRTVNVGASDVAADMFTQISVGKLKGPMAAAADTSKTRSNLAITDLSGVSSKTPVIVPFGFFVNKGVTWKKCGTATSTVDERNKNSFCLTSADCTGAGETCQSTTIDNITRPQAVAIFSKTATNWSDFGAYYDAKPIVACLRHAGSGTAAALDKTVMRGDVWGKGLWANAATAASYPPASNAYWYNDSSTDLMNCVDGQITGGTGSRGDIGAIGYADADQTNKTNTVGIKYNGVAPSRQAIRNGWYDFYTNQQLYYITADHTATKDTTPSSITITGGVGTFVNGSGNGTFGGVLDDLNNFASLPQNIPDGTGPGSYGVDKTKYWATDGEMRWNRASDKAYPIVKKTPTVPQTP